MNDLFVIGGSTGVAGAGQSILLISTSTGPGAFYCELYDDGDTVLHFTYTHDGTSFVHAGSQQAASRFIDGPGTLTYQRTGGTVRCASTWHDEPISTAGPVPPIDVARIVLYAENVEARLSYFIQIRTECTGYVAVMPRPRERTRTVHQRGPFSPEGTSQHSIQQPSVAP